MFYSPSIKCFYDNLSFYSFVPGDVKKISPAEHALIITQLNAKQMILDSDDSGNPLLLEGPGLYQMSEEEFEQEKARQLLLDTNYFLINKMDGIIDAIPSDIQMAREKARKILTEGQEK